MLKFLSEDGAGLEPTPGTFKRIDDEPFLLRVEKLQKGFNNLKNESELVDETMKQGREALEAVSFPLVVQPLFMH